MIIMDDLENIENLNLESETTLKVQIKKDSKRRKELIRLLNRLQYVFEISDPETLNAVIKI